MHVADDPGVSGRLRDFLAAYAVRGPALSEAEIRAAASLRDKPAPDDVAAAMVAYEQRYGGLCYPLIVGAPIEYGLDTDVVAYATIHGPAFAGILDGDRGCGIDVLIDGRTAILLPGWSPRIIERDVDQRLEKDALLAAVRGWPHRAYECFTAPGEPPAVRAEPLPTPVPEASGPADRWWFDEVTAVQLTLRGWWPGQDHWIARVFTRAGHLLDGEDGIVRPALGGGRLRPIFWCDLCRRGRPGRGGRCVPDAAAQPL